MTNDDARRIERDLVESESGINNVDGDGNGDNESKEDEDEDEDDDDESQPVAEHLMVDIKNVDTTFLDSEHLLVQAMLGLVEEAKVKVLSYHCHAFSPAGVSCVGLLLQNHIAFHTWPIEGVITFDLCTSKSKTILPLISSIERLFGIPRVASFPGQVIEQPEMRWTHKIRGFYDTPTEISTLYLSSDLRPTLLDDPAELKEEVSDYIPAMLTFV
jgi:S-adenosylmethionine/arginine decarboxylase-like enzyme